MIIRIRERSKSLMAAFLAGLLPLFAAAQDWPMTGGNSMRTGWAGNNAGIAPPLVAGAQVAVPVDGCEQFIITGGILYAAAGGEPNVLNAVDLSSGTVRWSFRVPGSRAANGKVPAAGAGIVLIGGQHSDSLFALRPADGTLMWSKFVGPSYARNAIIDAGRAFIVADSAYCMDAPSGESVWTYPFDRPTTPAVDAENVYLCGGGILHALNRLTGIERWRARVTAQSYGSVAVSGDLVLAAGRDTVYAVKKADGDVVWRAPLLGIASELAAGALAVSDDAVCGAFWNDPLDRGGVACFERSDGSPRWRHTFLTPGAMTPTIVDGVAYFVNWTERLLVGINMVNGGLVFQGTGVSAMYQPVVADSALWVSTGTGVIPFRSIGSGAGGFGPDDIRLSAFPNPSTSEFAIRAESRGEKKAFLEIVDPLGRRVALLADASLTAGGGEYRWNPAEAGLSAGLYMLVLRGARETRAVRLLYLK